MLVELPSMSEANKLLAEITLKKLKREEEELTAQTITFQNLEFFIEMKKQNDLPKQSILSIIYA